MTSRPLLIAGGALFSVLALGYGASFILYGDQVPRGVHVGGFDLSGLSQEQARAAVQRELADDAARPIKLLAGDVALELKPLVSGLRVDVAATVAEATSAGLLDRLRGLLGTRRDVEPSPQVRMDVLTAALEVLSEKVDRPAREGSITFTAATPVGVQPQPGLELDVDGAAEVVSEAYLREDFVDVPVDEKPVQSKPEDVERALSETARPAVAADVTVDVGGKSLVVRPLDIAAGLSFVIDGEGQLVPRVDGKKVLASLGSRVAAVSVEASDATFDVGSGKPVVVPSKDGRTVQPAALSSALMGVLTSPAPRRAALALMPEPARVTTAVARTLGVKEVIGTFTTRHPCCRPRVTNIHRIAEIVDGYVVLPGETFSLNGVVGRRDRARGFVEAPQIFKGQFVDDVGGGVSQFATTMFNAVFFSGLEDVEHKPHSYFISRYPPGREATVSFPAPDLRWRNDAPTGVLVKTSFTDRSITVTFWGTKRFDISSVSGERTRIRPFGKEYVDREDCTAADGAEGFDIIVTRIFRVDGAVVRREPFKTRYLPEPNFICGKPPPGEPAKQPPPPS